MSLRKPPLSGVDNERGAVAVLVAVMIPVMILFASFVIDDGNWFVHARHLQLQADAGALAGGQEFTATSCSDGLIKNRAIQYSGIPGGTFGTPYNTLTGNTTNVSENINQQAYPAQPSPPAPDSTPMTGNPCTDGLLDLKLTETPLPWFFQAVGIGGINAHARVSELQQTSGSGFLPIAVDETTPIAAKAYFIDESTNTTLASAPLTKTGTNPQGQAVWSNTNPLPVTISKPNVGVVIALSGDASNTTCPSTSQFVNCFDQAPALPGPSLVHIQGWSASGTGTIAAPLARSVTLQPGTGPTACADGYFANATSNCTFGVSAKVDTGTSNNTGVTVAAVMGGNSYPLSFNTSGPNAGLWTGTATLPTGTGSNQVDVKVQCDATVTGSPCFTGKKNDSTNVTLSDVQRAYAASSATSGTIANAGVSETITSTACGSTTCVVQDANSFQQSTTPHNLTVTIAVSGSLQDAQSVSDPLYVMRFGTSTSPSQTGAIACPPGGQGGLRINISQGCSGQYAVNTTDSGCVNTNPGPGGTPPPPADCVLTDNGLKTGQLKQGLAIRLANQTCPNNWSSFPNIPPKDPRIVHVFVTAYGSFGGSGNKPYPIQTFATFYVTGWDGDPCASDDPADKDQLVGHFIHYVDFSNPGGGGTQGCNLSSFGTCVVVLTQ